MYICKNCNIQQPSNTPSKQYILKKRNKIYPARSKANKVIENGRVKFKPDPGGIGFETDIEVTVCNKCYKKLTGSDKKS